MINDTKQTNTSPLMQDLSPHLSEDQINDALIGDLSHEVRLHLAACALCQAEVEPFQATLVSFNQATAAWSEAKSNTLNRDLSNIRPAHRFTPAALWSCASALVVAASIIFASGHHHDSASGSVSAPAGLVADNSPPPARTRSPPITPCSAPSTPSSSPPRRRSHSPTPNAPPLLVPITRAG